MTPKAKPIHSWRFSGYPQATKAAAPRSVYMEKSRISPFEAGVVILVLSGVSGIALLSAGVDKQAAEAACAAHLKTLGMAMQVYASDYDGRFPKLGTGPWSKDLGFVYDQDPVSNEGPRTITSSLYLLVRQADVAPGFFVCPLTEDTPFEGDNAPQEDGTQKKELRELWDFGDLPYPHVSYAYHNPYSRYPPHAGLPAAFPIAADGSPWFGRDNGSIVLPDEFSEPPQIITAADPATWPLGNSLNHRPDGQHTGEGQNVLYADGRVEHQERPNVGILQDNIYTFWLPEERPHIQAVQGGKAPDSRLEGNNAQSKTDSFLAI